MGLLPTAWFLSANSAKRLTIAKRALHYILVVYGHINKPSRGGPCQRSIDYRPFIEYLKMGISAELHCRTKVRHYTCGIFFISRFAVHVYLALLCHRYWILYLIFLWKRKSKKLYNKTKSMKTLFLTCNMQ